MRDGYAAFRQTLAKLTAMVATQRAMCIADPTAFLNRAYAEMSVMHKALLEVEDALNDDAATFAEAQACNVPVEHYKGDTAKLNRARDALRRYLHG